jgi:hypothetical protein
LVTGTVVCKLKAKHLSFQAQDWNENKFNNHAKYLSVISYLDGLSLLVALDDSYSASLSSLVLFTLDLTFLYDFIKTEQVEEGNQTEDAHHSDLKKIIDLVAKRMMHTWEMSLEQNLNNFHNSEVSSGPKTEQNCL